ncbi:protein kish-A isoform X1 [Pan paniscus]|uniref:protein kish-A isoform X1 n=1 Tax=Pan paniscus TaxID=9597 RepID=UPI00300548E7
MHTYVVSLAPAGANPLTEPPLTRNTEWRRSRDGWSSSSAGCCRCGYKEKIAVCKLSSSDNRSAGILILDLEASRTSGNIKPFKKRRPNYWLPDYSTNSTKSLFFVAQLAVKQTEVTYNKCMSFWTSHISRAQYG